MDEEVLKIILLANTNNPHNALILMNYLKMLFVNRYLIYFVCSLFTHFTCIACDEKPAHDQAQRQYATPLDLTAVNPDTQSSQSRSFSGGIRSERPNTLSSQSRSSSGGSKSEEKEGSKRNSQSRSSSGESKSKEKEKEKEGSRKKRLSRSVSFKRLSKVKNSSEKLDESISEVKNQSEKLDESVSEAKNQSEKLDELITSLPPIDNQWLKWDVSKIAWFLTKRDLDLFQAIKLEDMENYYKKRTYSEAITNLISHFDNTAHWLALQIVRAKSKKEREDIAKRLIFINWLLFKSHNFHGVMQFVTALTKPSVVRLLSPQKTTTCGSTDSNHQALPCFQTPIWIETSGSVDPSGNYKKYRRLFLQHKDEATCLPVLSILFGDLERASACGESKIHKVMNRISKVFQTISRRPIPDTWNSNPLPGEDDKDHLIDQFVWNFPKIGNETLEELSNIHHKWELMEKLRPQDFPPDLKDWTASHLASFLVKHSYENQIGAVFDLGIYDGMAIIHYLEPIPPTKEQVAYYWILKQVLPLGIALPFTHNFEGYI